eukprot:UN27516
MLKDLVCDLYLSDMTRNNETCPFVIIFLIFKQ